MILGHVFKSLNCCILTKCYECYKLEVTVLYYSVTLTARRQIKWTIIQLRRSRFCEKRYNNWSRTCSSSFDVMAKIRLINHLSCVYMFYLSIYSVRIISLSIQYSVNYHLFITNRDDWKNYVDVNFSVYFEQ